MYNRVNISSDEVFSKILKKPSIIQKKMMPYMKAFGLFNKMKKKKIQKKIQNGWLKKAHFSKSPILKIFSRKFLRFVLGLVGLNDAKGIDVAQPIWPWGCPTYTQKWPKNPKNNFLPVFELMLDSPTAR